MISLTQQFCNRYCFSIAYWSHKSRKKKKKSLRMSFNLKTDQLICSDFIPNDYKKIIICSHEYEKCYNSWHRRLKIQTLFCGTEVHVSVLILFSKLQHVLMYQPVGCRSSIKTQILKKCELRV